MDDIRSKSVEDFMTFPCLLSQCYAGADDLQEQMVLAGWAWAYTPYSDRYVPEEKDAMPRKVGVHAHHCQPPWEWRALKRAER